MRSIILLVLAASMPLASVAVAQSWRVGDGSYHIVARDLDERTGAGRAAMLARVERAAARLCEHEPLTRDRRACVAATVADAARRSSPLRIAMAERDATALAAR
ncbi:MULTISPECIES: UrcA family protein [unclassified Sphingomonas]|uniref:UrcA family protein n=1 Tax=unclassified Sphingomonas TaxID=196159 RepID=UPI00161F3D3C|nr:MULTISPECIES: UrcA family protein [unclassified Sphingomonas]MBB3346950.1 UrcA family protein [Sphingomonas sp. BK069]MBB3471787.1 UrcA family protein [Sphingomonas sp. BK345]